MFSRPKYLLLAAAAGIGLDALWTYTWNSFPDSWLPPVIGGIVSVGVCVGFVAFENRSHNRLKTLAHITEQTDNIVVVTDVNGRIVWVSTGFTRLTEYSLAEVRGGKPGKFLQGPATDPLTVRFMHDRLERREDFEVEIVNYAKNGRHYWIHVSVVHLRDRRGKLKGIFSINTDITKQKIAQQERDRSLHEILRAQRLESLGSLTGGIAHDLNNLLLPVIAGVQMLRSAPHDQEEILEMIAASAQQGSNLVKRLSRFARGSETERVSIDSQQLFEELADFVTRIFPKNVIVRADCLPGLSPVLGNPIQLFQALLNLCIHAKDGMPNGGSLTLDADSEEVARTVAGFPDARPGPYIVWRINDTGAGLPGPMVEQIFDPVIDAKNPEKAPVLRLAVAVGIVRTHGGILQVKSEVGRGSTFTIYLPEAALPPRTERRPATRRAPAGSLPRV